MLLNSRKKFVHFILNLALQELTAKGFEPALQKLISNHKAEIERLKNHHSQESASNEEKANDALRKREVELKKEMEDAVEVAHVEERRICDDEFVNTSCYFLLAFLLLHGTHVFTVI